MTDLALQRKKLLEMATSISETGALIEFDWLLSRCDFDKYCELTEGIMIRKLRNNADILFSFEEKAREALLQYDNECQFIFAECKKGCTFDLHYHYRPETMICVAGCFIETKRNVYCFPSQTVFSEAVSPHGIRCVEDTFIIVVIHPKIVV